MVGNTIYMTLPEAKKQKAVDYVKKSGKSVTWVARDLKVSRKAIYTWLKRKSLEAKYVSGKKHPKAIYPRAYSYINRWVVANPAWGCRKLSRELNKKGINLSFVQIHSLLKRIGAENFNRRLNYARNFAGPGRFLADLRHEIVKKAVDDRISISVLADDYKIARKTIYKWIRKYKNNQNLSDSYVNGNLHPRALYPRITDKVLAEVSRNPNLSVHGLAKILPISSWTIWKILDRSKLNTINARYLYASAHTTLAEKTAVSQVKDRVKSVFESFTPNLAPAPPPSGPEALWAGGRSFSSLLKIFLTSLISTSTISLIAIYWFNLLFWQSSGPVQSIGFMFAGLALLMGSFFFLYSLKYYATLVLVLSFSQKDDQGKIKARGTGNFFKRIFGFGAEESESNIQRNLTAPGLEPDLANIKLKDHPFISVHIPFYNEKNVVERAIRASTNFKYAGDYEVILCDDSTDETSGIITNYQKDCLFKNETLKVTKGEGWTLSEVEVRPGVVLKHLHRTSRDGYKGKALSLALTLTNPKAEFVSVFDADFVPYPDTLDLFLKYFQISEINTNTTNNPINTSSQLGSGNWKLENGNYSRVAAVQGYQWHVLNKSENWITRGVRSEYAGSYVVERSGAEIYGGLKQISGSVYMIKKQALEEVGWGTSITEDFELTLKLYEKGYKVLYTPYIQAPAECVSTLKRLVRQRMRWAEGHSFNVKKMFKPLVFGYWKESVNAKLQITNYKLQTNLKSQISNIKNADKVFIPSRLSLAEKFEFIYLAPYYLQALFFLVGTFAWMISETVFKVRLPFWTELWGWSLVLTNLFALPLVNGVGMFMEESEKKDYKGLASFLALSYLLVPFQAYAAIKGFMEKEEGPWFRTPKTGRITDIFARGRFMRFIEGFLPIKSDIKLEERYLSLTTANNSFNTFSINKKKSRWIGKTFLSLLLAFSTTITSFAGNIGSLNLGNSKAFGVIGDKGASPPEVLRSNINNEKSGVVAINTDKAVYYPGSTVKLSAAVLDYLGKMICDANLLIEIKKPSGSVDKINFVKINAQACRSKGINTTPDYEASFKAEEPGRYEIFISTLYKGVELKNKNIFEVKSIADFEIERIALTRINPKNLNTMVIKVRANRDFKGTVKDILPDNFKITGQNEWKVDWKKGNNYLLDYKYDSPDASPRNYNIGPLTIGKYTEPRKFSLAVDALTVVFLTDSGDWATPSDWNNSFNIIEVIGGGAGGASGSTTNAGGGGGGGGYSMKRNVSLSGTVSYVAGASVSAATNGNDSYFCNSTSNCGSIAGSAVQVGAKGGGTGGTTTSGTATAGTGGAAASGKGDEVRSGGNGGTGTAASSIFTFGGGGGAGGPRGTGANGGNGDTSPSGSADDGGGGGGGSGGGANGGNGGTAGGAGGGHIGTAGSAASQGGTAGNGATNPTSGSNGGGGGGADEGGASSKNGANGSDGTEYDSTPYGAGGGGGGSSASAAAGTQTGGNGGNYGAGGGAGETGGTGAGGLIIITYLPGPITTVYLTGSGNWTVPGDWDDNTNMIEVIGGGAGGRTDTTDIGGGGGGGGGYGVSFNTTLTPSGTVSYVAGASVSAGTAGNPTYMCNSTSNCASMAGSAVVVGGAGGSTTTTATGGAGGTAQNGVGLVRFQGGSGGNGSSTGDTGGGGGGAGGPHGFGGTGGVGTGALNNGGGGGGGNGGGANGSASGAGGGTGGDGFGQASSGGAGGTGTNGTAGSAGTGAGGGGADTGGFTGGAGAAGSDWDSGTPYGSGGGGGGTASSGTGGSGTGGAGGNYGGGGGGGGATAGGSGAAGVIVISYRRTSGDRTALTNQRKTWWDGTRYWRSYFDATNNRIMFEYSTNGTNWTENTSARIDVATYDFSIEADSSNLFIVYTSGFDVNGRVGSSYPGTGFSWGSEQTIFNGSSASDKYAYPVIARDSSNYIWVSANYQGGVLQAKTIKETSATNDLPEDSGDSVYPLPPTSFYPVLTSLNPLASNDMYILMTYGTSLIGCKWVNADSTWKDSSGNSCIDTAGTLNDGLVGYWQLEEASDATRVDSSGNGNDLTESSGDTIVQTTGKFGYGADFEAGDTEYLSIADQTEFNVGASFTLSAWIKQESSQAYGSVIGYGEGGDWSYNLSNGTAGGNNMMVEVDGDGFAGGGSEPSSAFNTVTNGTWALFTATYDGTTIRLYKDGSELTSGTFPFSSSVTPFNSTGSFYLGSWQSQSGYFDGVMDDVRIYNRPLTSTEVSNLNSYDPTVTPSYDTITSTLNAYSNISSVVDASGNVHALYINDSNQTVYQERTSSWQTAITLDSNAGNFYQSISYDTSNNNLYAFWVRGTTIYYKAGASPYASGNWDASATSWQTSSNYLSWVSSNYSGSGKIFAEWTEDSGVDPTVDWDILPVPELIWLFFGGAPLLPLLIKLKQKKYGSKKLI